MLQTDSKEGLVSHRQVCGSDFVKIVVTAQAVPSHCGVLWFVGVVGCSVFRKPFFKTSTRLTNVGSLAVTTI